MSEASETRALRKIVDSYGYSWGLQWRRNFGDMATFSIPSFSGKLIDQGAGAVGGAGKPRAYSEVFLGNALEFAIALKHVDERYREMAWMHYAVEMPKKAKAPLMGIHINTYDQRKVAMQLRLAKVLNLNDFNAYV